MGDYYGAYKAMEEMYKEGKLSAIGEKIKWIFTQPTKTFQLSITTKLIFGYII